MIAGFDQHATSEGVTLYRWRCSCNRTGKWTTPGLAESAGRKHVASGRVIGMNRYAASALCGRLWRHLGQPFTRIGRRSAAQRCQVGYLGNWPNNHVTIMGAGSTWEKAFDSAQQQKANP